MAVPAKLASYLSQKDLDAISLAVSEAESRTAGEIRVHIAHGLLPFEKPRARAIREFFRLGMDKTRDRTGVLLFLVLKKHRFEIVADQGIHSRVADGTWEQIARSVEKSICQGVQQIGDVLAQHVPRQADDQDELSNEVTFSESSSEKSSDPDPSQKS
jgi:uncharacterized membrane protein